MTPYSHASPKAAKRPSASGGTAVMRGVRTPFSQGVSKGASTAKPSAGGRKSSRGGRYGR